MLDGVVSGPGWVNVDGVRLRLEDGSWIPERPEVVAQGAVGFRHDGLVSVDGAWFNVTEGIWVAAPNPVSGSRSPWVVPEGFVSVDGALVAVEPT